MYPEYPKSVDCVKSNVWSAICLLSWPMEDRIVLALSALDKGNIPLYTGLSRRAARERGRRVGDSGDTGAGSLPCYERRMLLHAALGTGLGLLLAERTRAQDVEPRNAPTRGRPLCLATGERKGATIMSVDLPLGGPQSQPTPSSRTPRVSRWFTSQPGTPHPSRSGGSF